MPEELFVTNMTTGHVPVSVLGPVGLLNPVVDGRVSSYYEWLPAGRVETHVPSGAMTGGERREPALRQLLFGFDLGRLYFRLDLSNAARARAGDTLSCVVNFTSPANRRLTLTITERGAPGAVLYDSGAEGWLPIAGATPEVAYGDIVEASVSFADLGLGPTDPFAFSVSLLQGANELERHPPHRPVESTVPEPAFEKLRWKA